MASIHADDSDEARSPLPEKTGAERREHLRIPAPPVLVEGQWIGVYDIGVGGICLAQATPVERGARFDLTVTDGLVYNAQRLQAEVMWYSRGRVGLRWVDLTDDQRRWLEERSREWERATLSAQMRLSA